MNYSRPTAEALSSLKSNAKVTIEKNKYITFTPKTSTDIGFIFYPGGKVAAEAYAPLCAGIAEKGYKVVIVPMPLNFAIFGKDKAAAVISAYPEINHWAIGGHSLGGVFAANYAYNNAKDIEALILYASYPQNSNNMSNTDIKVLSLWGSEDGVANIKTILGSKKLLPKDSLFKSISGGNHAQFGNYGLQKGDNNSKISSKEQQQEAITYTVDLLKQLSTK